MRRLRGKNDGIVSTQPLGVDDGVYRLRFTFGNGEELTLRWQRVDGRRLVVDFPSREYTIEPTDQDLRKLRRQMDVLQERMERSIAKAHRESGGE